MSEQISLTYLIARFARTIIVGVVSKQGDEIIKKDGLAQTVTIMVPNENNKSIIENELLKYIYPLIQQVAVRF